jgi:hypothetical protein
MTDKQVIAWVGGCGAVVVTLIAVVLPSVLKRSDRPDASPVAQDVGQPKRADAKPTEATPKPAAAAAVDGFDWPMFQARAARVTVTAYEPVPLDTWKGVPTGFRTTPLVAYSGHELNGKGVVMPPAEFKVTRGGVVLVACDFSYQGNDKGGWTATRMTREQFVERGWHVLADERSGGALWKSDPKKPLVVFWRNVREGETYSLRCNKYAPPFVILPAKAD